MDPFRNILFIITQQFPLPQKKPPIFTNCVNFFNILLLDILNSVLEFLLNTFFRMHREQ